MSSFIARVRKFVRRSKPTSQPAADSPEPGPLSCRELVELVTAYWDGALSEPDVRRFDAHLAACDGCTRYVHQLRETIRLTGTLTEDQVPADARERLLGAFRGWSSGNPPS